LINIDPRKVRIYLPEQTITEKIDENNSLVINRQKTDGLLFTFSNYDSRTAEIVKTIASDDNLRTFFFLTSNLEYQVSRTYPVTQSFPFMLVPDYDLFQTLMSDYQKDITKIQEDYNSYRKELEDVGSTVFFEALGMVFTDERVIKAQRKRKVEDYRNAIRTSFESHKDEFASKVNEFFDSITDHLEDFSVFAEITRWLNLYDTAQRNTKVLSESGILNGTPKSFFASLNKLSESDLKISTKIICFDCVFKRKDFNFYKAETLNSKNLELNTKCPRCQGNGLIYQLIVSYPVGIHNIILPSSNWLPEVIVGYTLSSIMQVDKIYVHKKIHSSRKNEGLTSGVECDIAILTKDKKVILIEVSTTQETAQLHEIAHKKVEFFRKNKIGFDKFGFITADYNYGDYTWMNDKKGVIFKAKHLHDINKFIEETLIKSAS
jgi:hypothetical protein